MRLVYEHVNGFDPAPFLADIVAYNVGAVTRVDSHEAGPCICVDLFDGATEADIENVDKEAVKVGLVPVVRMNSKTFVKRNG